MLDIKIEKEEGKVCAALEGRLDTVTSPDLEKALNEALEDANELEMDFEKLEYISSAGLRVLLAAQKQMNKQGSMKLVKVNETIMGIFEVTGFSEILTIE